MVGFTMIKIHTRRGPVSEPCSVFGDSLQSRNLPPIGGATTSGFVLSGRFSNGE